MLIRLLKKLLNKLFEKKEKSSLLRELLAVGLPNENVRRGMYLHNASAGKAVEETIQEAKEREDSQIADMEAMGEFYAAWNVIGEKVSAAKIQDFPNPEVTEIKYWCENFENYPKCPFNQLFMNASGVGVGGSHCRMCCVHNIKTDNIEKIVYCKHPKQTKQEREKLLLEGNWEIGEEPVPFEFFHRTHYGIKDFKSPRVDVINMDCGGGNSLSEPKPPVKPDINNKD